VFCFLLSVFPCCHSAKTLLQLCCKCAASQLLQLHCLQTATTLQPLVHLSLRLLASVSAPNSNSNSNSVSSPSPSPAAQRAALWPRANSNQVLNHLRPPSTNFYLFKPSPNSYTQSLVLGALFNCAQLKTGHRTPTIVSPGGLCFPFCAFCPSVCLSVCSTVRLLAADCPPRATGQWRAHTQVLLLATKQPFDHQPLAT